MKQHVLLLFLFVLFCLGLVGCAAVYPQEELVVKGGFDGAYYIYSDKVNVYLLKCCNVYRTKLKRTFRRSCEIELCAFEIHLTNKEITFVFSDSDQ